MKKRSWGIIPLIGIALGLSGCSSIGDGVASLSVIYGVTAVLSALLLVGCLYLVRQNRQWFVLLFSSVLVVNIGYTFLPVSSGLEMALWANRVGISENYLYILTSNSRPGTNQNKTISPMLAKLIGMEFGYDPEWILHGESK